MCKIFSTIYHLKIKKKHQNGGSDPIEAGALAKVRVHSIPKYLIDTSISNRMRDAKKKRDEEKKKKIEALDIRIGEGKTSIDNDIIEKILNDEDPFAPKEQPGAVQEKAEQEELKVSTFVVDM